MFSNHLLSNLHLSIIIHLTYYLINENTSFWWKFLQIISKISQIKLEWIIPMGALISFGKCAHPMCYLTLSKLLRCLAVCLKIADLCTNQRQIWKKNPKNSIIMWFQWFLLSDWGKKNFIIHSKRTCIAVMLNILRMLMIENAQQMGCRFCLYLFWVKATEARMTRGLLTDILGVK